MDCRPKYVEVHAALFGVSIGLSLHPPCGAFTSQMASPKPRPSAQEMGASQRGRDEWEHAKHHTASLASQGVRPRNKAKYHSIAMVLRCPVFLMFGSIRYFYPAFKRRSTGRCLGSMLPPVSKLHGRSGSQTTSDWYQSRRHGRVLW